MARVLEHVLLGLRQRGLEARRRVRLVQRQPMVRQPAALRGRLAYDGKLFGAVSRLFIDSVLGWYRRRLSDR